jgi:hypothetical protein
MNKKGKRKIHNIKAAKSQPKRMIPYLVFPTFGGSENKVCFFKCLFSSSLSKRHCLIDFKTALPQLHIQNIMGLFRVVMP